jgi:large subunit ribosomal protein L23
VIKHQRDILLAPLVTEKTTALKNTNNIYTFKVNINANKVEIQKVVEELFHVVVLDVNTIKQRGKVKRLGRYSGKRADWKKAYIKLKDGDTIADFEA